MDDVKISKHAETYVFLIILLISPAKSNHLLFFFLFILINYFYEFAVVFRS